MYRPILFGVMAWLLVGCGSIEEEEVQEAAEAVERGVERGVEGAQRGLENTWEAAVDAYEEREHEKTKEAERVSFELLEVAAEAISCEVPGERCTVTAEIADRVREHPRALAMQVRVRPVKTPAVGIRINGMAANSIAECAGMEVGDVVTHVNGVAVGSMEDAMLLYAKVRTAKSFEVRYHRGEQERTLVLDVV